MISTRRPMFLMWPKATDSEPVDADVNMSCRGRILASRQIQIFALGRAAADEHGVELTGGEQLFHARHR